jgi:hypothetical protein
MGYPHFDLVQRAHSELTAEGKIRRRTEEAQVENDKGLVTRRAAYYANTERDPDHGILEKNYGNNSMGYSVDIIIDKSGLFWDVVTDSGGMAQPVDGGERGPDAELAGRWAQPTQELAQIEPSTPGPGPGPGPGTGGSSDAEVIAKLDEIIAMLNRQQETQARDTASIIARDDLNTQRIMDRLEQIVEDAEKTGKQVLALWMLQNRPGTTPPPEGEVPPGGELPGGGQNALLLLLLKALAGGGLPELPGKAEPEPERKPDAKSKRH